MDISTALGLLLFAALVGGYGTTIGAGGGFVLIPGLVLLFGLEGSQAVGTGMLVLSMIGGTGAVVYDRQGFVDRKVALNFAAGAVPAALLCGWFLADRIDGAVFIAILGWVLLALAAFVVFAPTVGEVEGGPRPPRRVWLFGSGVALGALSGTFAVGAGLISVALLSRLQRLVPRRAAGTTQAASTIWSFAAALGHAFAGNVVWSKAPILLVGAMAGSATAARASGRIHPRVVTALLAGGLVASGLLLILRG